MSYLIDTSVVIQVKNSYYAFDIAPGFWNQLLGKVMSKDCIFIDSVVHEIDKGKDELKDWFEMQIRVQQAELIAQAEESAEVYENYKKIANFVSDNKMYDGNSRANFMKGADPWIIAAAKTWNHTVVTFEQEGQNGNKHIKIPNVCKEFHVPFMNLFDMMRQLGIKL